MMRQYKDNLVLLNSGFITQSQFLDWLYNKCGPFKVQRHIQGEKPTKWHDWMYIRETDYKNTYNHRTIAQCELVFDLDIPGWLSEKERSQTLKMTLRRLRDKYNIQPVVIDTGKGYHLHWFDVDMAISMSYAPNPSEYKRKYAQAIMSDVRSDLMKWNHNTMIAIECSNHWKRNTKMKLILE